MENSREGDNKILDVMIKSKDEKEIDKDFLGKG